MIRKLIVIEVEYDETKIDNALIGDILCDRCLDINDVYSADWIDTEEGEVKVIRDTETGEEMSFREVKKEYERLKQAGETEAETLDDYLENITGKDGTCEWI